MSWSIGHELWPSRGSRESLAPALMPAVTMPTAAQQRSVPEILARLHAPCGEDYKPACIKFGLVIGRLPTLASRKLRRDHPGSVGVGALVAA